MHITAAVFSERMFMARCELSGVPTVRVYEVDPASLHVPDYNKPRARVIPREQKAWFGQAERKLCSPGFAAFGATRTAALDALLRVMRECHDSGAVKNIGDAIRKVSEAMNEEAVVPA